MLACVVYMVKKRFLPVMNTVEVIRVDSAYHPPGLCQA